MVTHTLDQTWTDAETEQTMAWAVPDRKGTIRCHLPNTIRKGKKKVASSFQSCIEPVSHKPTQAEENTTQQYSYRKDQPNTGPNDRNGEDRPREGDMDATAELFQDDLDVPDPGEEASDQDSGQLQPNTVARVSDSSVDPPSPRPSRDKFDNRPSETLGDDPDNPPSETG